MSTEIQGVKDAKSVAGNKLFPVFLKLNQLHTLVVGGGNVAAEKLRALLGNDADARITVIGEVIQPELLQFLKAFQCVEVKERRFFSTDLNSIDLLIVAVNDRAASEEIALTAKKEGVPVNVADKPDLCDFYLSSIVQKGQVKLAISTNGYSPTLAKRLKEYFENGLPEEINETAENLHLVRQGLNGTFNEKVRRLNEITAGLVAEPQTLKRPSYKATFIWGLGILGLMIAGHLIFSLIPVEAIGETAYGVFNSLDDTFFYFVLGGFIAQMIDYLYIYLVITLSIIILLLFYHFIRPFFLGKP